MLIRRLAATLAAALMVTASVVATRDGDGDDDVAAGGDAPTSSSSTSSASRSSSSTSPTSSTTAVPSTSTTDITDPTTTRGPTVTANPPPTTRPPAPPATTPAPAYRSSIEPVSAAQLGSSWKPGFGCPDPSTLRAVNVTHWGYDGGVKQGRVIVAANQAENVAAIFGDLYRARFPIERIVPVDAYGADDQASMRANNTSGFNCRYVAGTTRLSQHGLGAAIDLNPLHNPYVKNGAVDPPEGARWADRSRNDPGMIKPGAVVDAFARRGWAWGGYWAGGKDYQHFSPSGT